MTSFKRLVDAFLIFGRETGDKETSTCPQLQVCICPHNFWDEDVFLCTTCMQLLTTLTKLRGKDIALWTKFNNLHTETFGCNPIKSKKALQLQRTPDGRPHMGTHDDGPYKLRANANPGTLLIRLRERVLSNELDRVSTEQGDEWFGVQNLCINTMQTNSDGNGAYSVGLSRKQESCSCGSCRKLTRHPTDVHLRFSTRALYITLNRVWFRVRTRTPSILL